MTGNEPGEPSEPRWARWEGLLLLLLVILPFALYGGLLVREQVFYEFDSLQLHYPRYRVLRDSLLEGRFPALWQSALYAGSPFHANPENPTLYPPALLAAWLLEPVRAMHLINLVHLAFGGIGMYCLVRRLAARAGLPAAACAVGAFLGGLQFALNGHTRLEHFNLVTYGAALTWMPWIFLGASGVLHGERPRRAAGGLGLALGLQVWTGGLYVIAYSTLGLVLWMATLGLLGSAERRRRALVWGGAAAAVAGLMGLARALPFVDWVGLTNRSIPETMETLRGATLGGPDEFAWSRVELALRNNTSRYLILVSAALSFALVRRGEVRALVGLALLGFGAGLGGPVWEFLYRFVPPFDSVRVSIRAWTLPAFALPALGGLGLAWAAARFAVLERRAGVALAAALVLGGASLPLLLYSWRFERLISDPPTLEATVARYPNWGSLAASNPEGLRAYWLDDKELYDKNEQFITSHLGVETPAGYLGHVWPLTLADHLWLDQDTARPEEARVRRLGVLSVGLLVTGRRGTGRTLTPKWVDGARVFTNPDVRPRAFAPRAVVAIAGDGATEVTGALLDDPDWPLGEAALVHVEDGARLPNEAWGAIELLVATDGAGAAAEAARARGVEVLDAPEGLDDAARSELVARVVGTLPVGVPAPEGPRFEVREEERSLLVDGGERPGRFVVVSERWASFPEWRLSAGGQPLATFTADGVVTAFWWPKGTTEVEARFVSPSTTAGLGLGALGLLLGAVLLLLPGGARRTADAASSG